METLILWIASAVIGLAGLVLLFVLFILIGAFICWQADMARVREHHARKKFMAEKAKPFNNKNGRK